MTSSTNSSTASGRIAYALSRRQGTLDPVAQENAAVAAMQENFNTRVNAISAAIMEEHTERAELSNLSLGEMEALQPFQESEEDVALLKDRVVQLRTHKDKLHDALIVNEEHLMQQNQSKQHLITHINELRQVLAMQNDWFTGRIYEVGSEWCKSASKSNREVK